MYIEASGQAAGSIARLITPSVIPETRNVCWRFMYHMKGDDIGELSVSVSILFIPLPPFVFVTSK